MPYTPPHQSPVSDSSIPLRPSRTYFSSPSTSPPRSPHSGRPSLPRSASSSQYMHKQRHSPKFSPVFADHVEEVSPHIHVTTMNSPKYDSHSPRHNRNNNPVSPPDSGQNSSDDESKPVHTLQQLHEAVRRLEINRNPSPTDEQTPPLEGRTQSTEEQQQDMRPRTPPGHLSSTARKITHSRSSTETSILNPPMTPQQEGSYDELDDDEEDIVGPKPPLIRKKSGELVKPAIRPRTRRKHSSMPGTPTYSKAVHFNDDIEQVRHFLQGEKPLAVSAGTSPVETYDSESEFPWLGSTRNASELDMTIANFPRESLERKALPIRVERLWLAADKKHLMGAVAVANLAFQKHVAARFTFDHWRTTSEVIAEYNVNPSLPKRTDGYDNFQFSIKLTDQGSIETKSLLLCMRYYVNGQEYWDNNHGNNYQVEFTKVQKSSPAAKKASPGLGARPIPRSRHNSPAGRRPRSMPSFEDDFSSGFDGGPNFKFRTFANDSKPPTLPDTPPPPKVKQGVQGQQFGSRYDFGASLTAALSQAQNQAGSSSPVTEMPPVPSAEVQSAPGLTRQTLSRSGTDSPRPEALLANHQSLDSRAYQEFVSKFCFFNGKGTKGPSGSPSEAQTEQQPPAALPKEAQEFKFPAKLTGTDGAREPADFPSGPVHITDSNGQSLHFDNKPSRQTDVRSTSPSDRDHGPRSPSPMAFGYPYSGRGGFFSGTTTPPAIRS